MSQIINDAEINTYDTVSTSVITGVDTVYRVHVGDFNGSGTDIITEVASPDTAYRSTALVNLVLKTDLKLLSVYIIYARIFT